METQQRFRETIDGRRPPSAGPSDEPLPLPSWVAVCEPYWAGARAEAGLPFAAGTRTIAQLVRLGSARGVAEVAEWLDALLTRAWDGGWQPLDLHRFVVRRQGRSSARLLRAAIGSQATGYAELGERVAPAWMRQLSVIGAAPGRGRRAVPGLLEGAAWIQVVEAVVVLTPLLVRLPAVPVLAPPPSAWRAGDTVVDPATLPAPVLDEVRSLLAEAESTTFAAEAEASTAEAQALMARHRIDEALLAAGRPGGGGRASGERPVGRRIGVDDPYPEAKAVLLAGIAGANGCQAMWTKGFGFSTVIGFPDELEIVDVLYTSLLVQATAALHREGAGRDGYGRRRTTRFRRSFLVAFAERMADRLDAAVDAAVADADATAGRSLVPVLAARKAAIDDAMAETFPRIGTTALGATDAGSWHAGTRLADHADLGTGRRPQDRIPDTARP
jgi:hypothetical protein